MADAYELEWQADRTIEDCGGDPRAAVKALLVLFDAYEAELLAVHGELERAVAAVSAGYVRQRFRDHLP